MRLPAKIKCGPQTAPIRGPEEVSGGPIRSPWPRPKPPNYGRPPRTNPIYRPIPGFVLPLDPETFRASNEACPPQPIPQDPDETAGPSDVGLSSRTRLRQRLLRDRRKTCGFAPPVPDADVAFFCVAGLMSQSSMSCSFVSIVGPTTWL